MHLAQGLGGSLFQSLAAFLNIFFDITEFLTQLGFLIRVGFFIQLPARLGQFLLGIADMLFLLGDFVLKRTALYFDFFLRVDGSFGIIQHRFDIHNQHRKF